MNIEGILQFIKLGALNYGVKILIAIAILIIGRLAAGIVKSVVKKAAKKANTETTVTGFIANISYVATLIFFVIAALRQLGIETNSLVAVLGAAGLAIALALQGSLSNFAAGFLVILFKPFKAGDYIEGGGVGGTVKEIQIFTTVLTTPDNKKVIVPNSKLTTDNIINYTTEETRRIDLVVGVGYNDDLKKVKETLTDILSHYSEILPEPAPVIAVSNLGDSSVDFVVRPWVKTQDYWDVRFRLNEEIKNRFDDEDITIPFPQRDVHVFKE